MSDAGRLIINRRGETAQVIPAARHADDSAVLRIGGLIGEITVTPEARFTYDIALSQHELTALALKAADAAGLICELRPKESTHG